MQIFEFDLTTYRPATPATHRTGTLRVPGNNQYHARRRLMDRLYKEGWFVKSIKCNGRLV